jgi:cyclopropane fatty-acyl-phospholipid synthase-like methyltransferase
MSTGEYNAASHYDRVTEAWKYLLGEELHYGLFESGDEPLPAATNALTARMREAAQLAEGLRLLDVGCGTGAPGCELAGDHGIEVLGISTSAVGVAAANDRAAAAGLSGRARFEVRDAMDNGLDDASFDRVWALESSHLMPDRPRMVAEAARVLRPGGRFVLCDIIRLREIPFAELREKREKFAVLRAGFGAARMDELSEYEGYAAAAGLEVDFTEDLTALARPTLRRWRENADANREQVLDLVGEEGLAAFVGSCDILEEFWGDGMFGYGLIAAVKPR